MYWVRVGVLLGLDAGVILAMVFLDLVIRRVLRVKLARPLTLVRTGETEPEERDQPVLLALDPKGRLRGDGLVDLLEDLYDDVNGKMAGHSGSETVTLLTEKVAGLWEAVLAEGIPSDAVIPWLLLREPDEVWDRMPADGRWALLRDLYRIREQVRAGVELPASVRELRREREDGFFRWYREPHA